MVIRIVGFIATSAILYIIGVRIAGNASEKSLVTISELFKFIFGFWKYRGNRFSLKSIVFQSLNLLGIVTYCATLATTNKIDLSVEFTKNIWILNFFITGLVGVVSRLKGK